MTIRQYTRQGMAVAALAAVTVAGCGERAAVEPELPAVLKVAISTEAAPKAVGPYSQGVRFGAMFFASGQIAIDPATGAMLGGPIEDQTRQVLDNLKAVLEAGGMTTDDVVSTTVYLKNLTDFAKMNDVYAEYFGDVPPARATVEVSRLPRDALIEISAIAAK